MTRLLLVSLAIFACAYAAATPVYVRFFKNLQKIQGKCGRKNEFSIGKCETGKAGPCGRFGYACDASLSHCCPAIDVTDPKYSFGPSVGGMCPVGYYPVQDFCVFP